MQDQNEYNVDEIGYIFNATNEEQTFKAFGHHFTMKPKQIKGFRPKMALYISEYKADQGLVLMPSAWADVEYRATKEGKEIHAKKEEEGLGKYLGHLRSVIYNNQVSLRQDLERGNLKVDPAALASDGELYAMRIVSQYKRMEEDKAQKRIDEVKKLMDDVGELTPEA